MNFFINWHFLNKLHPVCGKWNISNMPHNPTLDKNYSYSLSNKHLFSVDHHPPLTFPIEFFHTICCIVESPVNKSAPALSLGLETQKCKQPRQSSRRNHLTNGRCCITVLISSFNGFTPLTVTVSATLLWNIVYKELPYHTVCGIWHYELLILILGVSKWSFQDPILVRTVKQKP